MIGNTLKRRRELLGLSQAELARRLGIARARISEWERDVRRPNLTSLELLAEALDTSIARLVRNV